MKDWIVVVIALISIVGIGCVHATPGGNLSDINPELGPTMLGVQNTVDGYALHLDGGKLISSRRAGVLVNRSILDHWTALGRIDGHEQVDNPGAFDDNTRYHISLGGTQDGESNIALQLIGGFSLGIIPWSMTMTYDIEYTVVDTVTNCVYTAHVTDSVKVIHGWLTAPWHLVSFFGGKQEAGSVTMTRISNHLYNNLRKQGAFNRNGCRKLMM